MVKTGATWLPNFPEKRAGLPEFRFQKKPEHYIKCRFADNRMQYSACFLSWHKLNKSFFLKKF